MRGDGSHSSQLSYVRLDLVSGFPSLLSSRTCVFSFLEQQNNWSCFRGQMLSPPGAWALAKVLQQMATSLWHIPWLAPGSQVSRIPLGPAGALSAWSSFHTCTMGTISTVHTQCRHMVWRDSIGVTVCPSFGLLPTYLLRKDKQASPGIPESSLCDHSLYVLRDHLPLLWDRKH